MRIFLFFIILLLTLEQFWLVLLPLLFWYAVWYQTYELIIVAVLIDGYVGGFYDWPLYTIITTALVLILEWVRPRIMFYTN